MIIRGTTPTIKFTFKTVDPQQIVTAYLTMKQGELVIEKTLADGTVGENYIEWQLSQAETVSLDDDENINIQCRYKLADSAAYASKIYSVPPYDILKDGVI